MDYFFTDSDWSTGANFNAIKSETRENGKWEKLTVDSASPSKASAWVNWAPGDWTLRVQSTQTFDVSDADGKKIDGYNTVDFWVATPAGGQSQLQRGEPAGQRLHHRTGPARTGAV